MMWTLFACFIISFSAHVDGATHTEDNLLDFFPSTEGDGLNVIWAHGVNSLADLNQTLADDTMMIETDIILRDQTNIPVHAHPPLTDSDLTLEYFLQVTTQHSDKGMKLDFKSLEALEPSMKLIKESESELKAPLWLNADIVIGPNSPRDPVAPQEFIDIANRYFDKTTFSLGFTTGWSPIKSDKMYTWTMIFDNLYYSYPLDPQPVTFPIRAVWCKTSWSKFVWLLGLRESFSITVWSSASDAVDVGGLVDLRAYGDMKRIFYDLPDIQKQTFLDALNDPSKSPSPPLDSPWDRGEWVGFENQEGRNFAFFSSEGLGISGNAPRAAIIHSKRQHMPETGEQGMEIVGYIQFVDRYDSTSTATVEIFIRSRSLLDDEEAREEILSGNRDPSGYSYSVSSDGNMAINGTQLSQPLSAAECYKIEIDDHADGSMQVAFIVKTCADALEEDPNAETSILSFPEVEMDDDQEYYVILMKSGSGKDVIIEGFHVEGSREPDDGATHTQDNLLDFFPSTEGDGLNVIWAHGVNSLADLNQTLADDTMMIETDIILRDQTNIPVHAHPPLTDSDLTLEYFLQVTTQHSDKGMKLDFKSLEALEPSMKLIKESESELKAPLWLNADIVIGPNSPRDPVAPQEFIDIANRYFNKTTFSLGFTTGWSPIMPDKMYTWTMIFDNLYYSYPLDPQPVTFPIRAVWCKTSWSKFVWLLGLRESFSITVWSSASDVVDVGGLVDLRAYGDMKRIFYDLPDNQKQMFLDALDDSTITPSPPLDSPWDRDQWVGFENQDERNFAFFSSEGLGISGNAPRAAIIHSKRQYMPEVSGAMPMVLKGRVQFVGRNDAQEVTSLEIFIRSRSLLDDEEARDEILAGNTDPSGLKFSIFSDGRIISEICNIDVLPSKGCYDIEINDTLDASWTFRSTARTCADALEEDPNDGISMSCTSTDPDPMECQQEYYVIVIGGEGGIILEGLTVDGSQPMGCTTPDPDERTKEPTEGTTESKGNSRLISHGLSSWLIISMMVVISVSSMHALIF